MPAPALAARRQVGGAQAGRVRSGSRGCESSTLTSRARLSESSTPNFDDVVAEQIKRGNTLPLNGMFSGVKVAYLPTDRDLGVILETFSGMPGADHESAATENA